ncbi:MAG: antibiotic biosynthesis monooxygenase [Pseudomonadota bacterium]
MNEHARAVIKTTVAVKPGHLEAVADLFAKTNPPLVASEPDWLEAVMTCDIESNAVTVLAFWSNPASYLRFSASAAFTQTMRDFAPHLDGAPVVSLSHVVVGMTQDAVWRAPQPMARSAQKTSSPDTV